MVEKIPVEVERKVHDWLNADDCHLASHAGANYCYLSDNSFDYDKTSSFSVQLQAAWEDGSISTNDDGDINVCGHVIPIS